MYDFEPSEYQNDAINCRKGLLAISAHPGSGKTATISMRIAELVMTDEVKPSSIAAFTFTVRAAEELRSRVHYYLKGSGLEASKMSIGTIDAFCLAALKKIRPEYHGFRLLDTMERVAFVRARYEDIKIDSLRGSWKNSTASYDKIKEFCNSVDSIMRWKIDIDGQSDPDFQYSYKKYREALKEEKFMDFVTVIHTLVEVLSKDEDQVYLKKLGIKHVVVDEYQDVDKLQEELVYLLSNVAESTCVVGDGNQSIFGWRGGDPARLDRFKKIASSKDSDPVELRINYRATDKLVTSASKLISRKHGGEKSQMLSDGKDHHKFEPGDILYPGRFENPAEEEEFICKHIKLIHGTEFLTEDDTHALGYGDMVVLVDKNSDAISVADRLESRDIPCEVDMGAKIFREPIIELAVDCLMYTLGGKGNIDDLGREYARIVSKTRRGSFVVELSAIRDSAGSGSPPEIYGPGSHALVRVISAMGAEDGLLDDHMRALAELSRAVSKYEHANGALTREEAGRIHGYVDSLANHGYLGQRERSSSGKDVRVMTVWKAKGLEFPVVFVHSFGRPRKGSIGAYVDPAPRQGADSSPYENSRRLFYTAITRSQKHLILTDTEKYPQRFIDDMDQDSISSTFKRRPPAPAGGNVQRHALFTYDSVASYGRCPYEYYLRHTLGFKADSDKKLDYSSNTLSILYQILGTCIEEGRIMSEDEILDIVNKTFHMPLVSESEESKMRERAVGELTRYVSDNADEISRGTASNTRLEHVISGASVSDEAGMVCDKTDPAVVTEFDASEDIKAHLSNSRRSCFHVIAASGTLERDTRSSVYYLGVGRRVPVDTGQNAIEEAKARISRAIDGINSGNTEGTPEKDKCLRCSFLDICKYKKSVISPDQS
ncbi:MAG: ATP-dependent helicase [Hyphomicrobiaceae bacterium]|nr:ATP-dependent helicase [Hyphomicrobiaceae bacterium]